MAPSVGAGNLLCILLSLIAAAYIRAVVRKQPKGLWRILFATPIFAAFAGAPAVLFDRRTNVVAVLLASAFLLWWGNFKVVALCWGKGPLENQPRSRRPWLDFLGFTALLSLPVVVVTKRGSDRASPGECNNKGADERKRVRNGVSGVSELGLQSRLQGSEADKNGVQNGFREEAPVVSGYSSKPDLIDAEQLKIKPPEQQWLLLLKSSLAHGALFVSLIYLLDIQDHLPEIIIRLDYVGIMYSFMMFSFPLCAIFASAALGVELFPHFDRPWLSKSLADFWGHRWNLTANRVLRDAVYFPLKEQLERVLINSERSHLNGPNSVAKSRNSLGPVKALVNLSWLSQARRSRIAKGIAALATFFVSGFMHEVFIYYATGEASGEWTAFFTLHGTAFLVESEVVIPVAKYLRIDLPRWMKILVTLAFFMVTADLLFFPPVIRSGLDRAGLNEFRTLLKTVTGV